MTTDELTELARKVWGQSARVRFNRSGAVVETFEQGEVLVCRHPDRERAVRMVSHALTAEVGEVPA